MASAVDAKETQAVLAMLTRERGLMLAGALAAYFVLVVVIHRPWGGDPVDGNLDELRPRLGNGCVGART